MTVYVVHCETVGHEVYNVEAETEEDARRIVESGEAEPTISEVITLEIDHVIQQKEHTHGSRD